MFIISKIIPNGENNFTQNAYNKLQKISVKNKCFFAKHKCKSANMGSSTFNSLDRYANLKLIIKNYLYII